MLPIINNIKLKILDYIKTAVFLFIFLLLYSHIPSTDIRYILLYFLALASLYFSFKMPELVFVINTTGIVLIFISKLHENWTIITALILFFMAAAVIPLYFGWARRRHQEDFQKRRKPKVQKIDNMQNELIELETQLYDLEKKIDRINRLYNLGRELVEHMDINEVINNLQRVILSRPGIGSVSIFSLDKNNWEPLYFSQEQYREQWLDYINQNKPLFAAKKFKILPAPVWISGQAVVFWPVRLEKDLLAAIILTTTGEMASYYLEEGEIFIPQIALGLKRTNLFAEVQQRSRVDGLTGLYLRRYFLERFQLEIQRAKRYASVFSVLMADIDFFKKVNDTYGHLVGDDVLNQLARLIMNNSSPSALVGRYGGEEFIALLPLVNPEESLLIAKKINKAVNDHIFKSGNYNFRLSLSIGISHYPLNGTSVNELLNSSDHALYWVKTHGRNNVKEFSEKA